MARLGGERAPILAGVVLAGLAAVALTVGHTEEPMPTTTAEHGTIPPVDLAVPTAVETATFALG